MTNTAFVQAYIKLKKQGEHIYTEEIAEALAEARGLGKKQAVAAVAVAVKRMIDGGKLPDLRCYQKGIYYRTVDTPFGEMGINKEKLIAEKYLLPDKGYETVPICADPATLGQHSTIKCLLCAYCVRHCSRLLGNSSE